jgi:hypothetical protein
LMTCGGKIMLSCTFDYSVQQSRRKRLLMRFSGPQRIFLR